VRLLIAGRVQDSLRELETLSNKPDINLCSLLALIHGHRKAKSIGTYSYFSTVVLALSVFFIIVSLF